MNIKNLKDYIIEKKQVSEMIGFIGYIWKKYLAELAATQLFVDLFNFVKSHEDELIDEAKKYVNNNVILELKRIQQFKRAYQYLYNIILAGYEYSRLH